VSLEGRVRPQDISDGNVVLSTRLAEARITYLGEGELSQRQQRAWWRKLLDWVGMLSCAQLSCSVSWFCA
jgi:flagellar L-ring protein precursor FlgH